MVKLEYKSLQLSKVMKQLFQNYLKLLKFLIFLMNFQKNTKQKLIKNSANSTVAIKYSSNILSP